MRDFQEIKNIYTKVFQNINGYGVSLLEKESNLSNPMFKDLLYGETPIELLYALFYLDPVNKYLEKAKTFYDLGSGIGNNVIGASLIHNFDKCIGVELLNSLYNLSLEAKNNLKYLDKNAENKIKFHNDNILNFDISDADIVYFSCPTKNDELRFQMEEKFKTVKSGTIFLSLIHQFRNNNDFELISNRMVKSAWGEAPMMFYKRK